jgi:hypothetical protein
MRGLQASFVFDVDEPAADDPAKAFLIRRLHAAQEIFAQPVIVERVVACATAETWHRHGVNDERWCRSILRRCAWGHSEDGVLAIRETR